MVLIILRLLVRVLVATPVLYVCLSVGAVEQLRLYTEPAQSAI